MTHAPSPALPSRSPETFGDSLQLPLRNSDAHLQRARRTVPGVTHSMMKRPEMFDLGAYPVFLQRGDGALATDVDENQYVDFICGLGANTLGHGHPTLHAAITAELQRGILHSLPSPVELTAAEAVQACVPGAEMVRFFKTGADATSAAIRLARHVTGKEQVVVVGYNGWHDHFMFDTPGVPKAVASLTHRMPLFTEQDEAPLLSLVERKGSELAVVLLSVPYNRVLSSEFVRALRERCRHHGVLFALDEIVTGFRVALGGVQELLGVDADLICLSKGLAAGMPLSAIAGPAAIMQAMSDLQVSTTFGGETLSLAACCAALELYQHSDYIDRIAELGRRLSRGINQHSAQLGTPLRIVGYDPIPLFHFSPDLQRQAVLARPFVGAMARRGVLLRRDVNFLCGAHTEAQIDFTIDAARESLRELRDQGVFA